MRFGSVQIGALAVLFAASGCNKVGFDAVSVYPIFGWEDGCTTIRVSGHGFGDNPTVTIGGQTIEDLTPPTVPEEFEGTQRDDAGFYVDAYIPAAPPGLADVTVTNSDGESDTIVGAYYYEACYGAPYPEWSDLGDTNAIGDTITMGGCGYAEDMVIRIGASPDADFSLVECTHTGSFVVPDPGAPGSYYVGVFDANGNQIFPDPVATGCENVLDAPGTWVGGDDPETPDEDESYDFCGDAFLITIGS